MKKNYILTLLLLVIGVYTHAQITVTNSTFPVAGDELRTTTDLIYRDFDPVLSGENQTWDLTDLIEGVTQRDTFKSSTEGADFESFPDSELLLSALGGVQDIYYDVTDTLISEAGRVGFDPIFEAVPFDVTIEGNAVLRRAPIAYGDTFTDEYGFGFEIPVSALPDSIVSLFDFGIFTPSDIRIRVDISILDNVDSWGMISIPAGDYDALRIKRETTTNTGIELKILGQWADLGGLPITLPEFAEQLVMPSTVTSYVFINDVEKEEIAVVTVDSLDMPISTTFKAGSIIDNTLETDYSNAEILAYPNPSYGDVRFEFKNLPADRYKVAIHDILGKKVWSKTSRLGQSYLDSDLSELRRGTYLYRVFDSKGRKLTTKRLMIIRP